jgi:hypothetical protein
MCQHMILEFQRWASLRAKVDFGHPASQFELAELLADPTAEINF